VKGLHQFRFARRESAGRYCFPEAPEPWMAEGSVQGCIYSGSREAVPACAREHLLQAGQNQRPELRKIINNNIRLIRILLIPRKIVFNHRRSHCAPLKKTPVCPARAAAITSVVLSPHTRSPSDDSPSCSAASSNWSDAVCAVTHHPRRSSVQNPLQSSPSTRLSSSSKLPVPVRDYPEPHRQAVERDKADYGPGAQKALAVPKCCR